MSRRAAIRRWTKTLGACHRDKSKYAYETNCGVAWGEIWLRNNDNTNYYSDVGRQVVKIVLTKNA